MTTIASKVSNFDYSTFVTNTLHSYKSDPVFGLACQQALNDRKWINVNQVNEESSYLVITSPKLTYLFIIRDYDMLEKLLRAPPNSSVLYIIYKFYGVIPPRPKSSIVKYKIHTPILISQQSNLLIYRWFMPKSYNLTHKATIGTLASIKKSLKKGYSLNHGETYDLNEYVYDENVLPDTYSCHMQTEAEADAELAKEASESFYRIILEKLIKYDKPETSEDLLGAVQNAIQNTRDWISLKDDDKAVYYHNGTACVCIKKMLTVNDKLELGTGDALVIIDCAQCLMDTNEINMSKINSYLDVLINGNGTRNSSSNRYIDIAKVTVV